MASPLSRSILAVAALALLWGAQARAGVEAAGPMFGLGVDRYPLTWIKAGEIFAVELQLDLPHQPWDLDLIVDWEQAVVTTLFTSQPRIGITGLADLRRPLGPRLDLALSPGADLEWGRDARVIAEQLRWVPAGSFGLTSRLGLAAQVGRRWEIGLYGRGVAGFRAGQEGPEAWRQAYVELSATRATRPPPPAE